MLKPEGGLCGTVLGDAEICCECAWPDAAGNTEDPMSAALDANRSRRALFLRESVIVSVQSKVEIFNDSLSAKID